MTLRLISKALFFLASCSFNEVDGFVVSQNGDRETPETTHRKGASHRPLRFGRGNENLKQQDTRNLSGSSLTRNLFQSWLTSSQNEQTTKNGVGHMTSPLILSSSSSSVEKGIQASSTVPRNGCPKRNALAHKRWGVDNDHGDEYWFDARIHTLGNIGIGGAIHAALAQIATKLIDLKAYDGIDLRAKVGQELGQFHLAKLNRPYRVLDLCCGVGTSTRALSEALPHAELVVGLDTSPQMVAMASFLTKHLRFFLPQLYLLRQRIEFFTGLFDQRMTILNNKQPTMEEECDSPDSAVPSIYHKVSFARGNAQDTKLPDMSFDLVTCMYTFHEAPRRGREKILEEARRLLSPGGTLAIIDISTDYQPSRSMLAGEPYVLEYQSNIHKQMRTLKGFVNSRYTTLVPGHVGMWTLRRAPSVANA